MSVVILGFSGGLDTTFSVLKLKEAGHDVVAVTVDIGQQMCADQTRARAEEAGCADFILVHGVADFAEFFVAPAIQANALYQDAYPLATALGRPYIAYCLAHVARSHGTTVLSHGCTGKGNDQARIELGVRTLMPVASFINPVRDEGYSRDTELEYLLRHGLVHESDDSFQFSIDENLWGRSISAGSLEDPDARPPDSAFEITASVQGTPDEAVELDVEFELGVPTSIDGEELSLVDLIERLNGIAGRHGVGRIDHMEDRIVGLKSREVYEAPAAVVLLQAHKALESLVLTRPAIEFKRGVSHEFARLVYDGMWFTSHWMDLMTYIRSTQRHVTGTVTMRLHKGTATVVGRRSAHSLYSRELMTYSAASTFNQGAAKSFLEIYGLQAITDAARQMRDAAQMRSIPSERPTAPTSLLPPPPTLA